MTRPTLSTRSPQRTASQEATTNRSGANNRSRAWSSRSSASPSCLLTHLSAETVDPHSSLFRYSSAPLCSTVTVPRSSTLIDLAPLIEELYRIPAARQECWLVAPRFSYKYLRARARLEPRGQHAGLSIEQITRDLTQHKPQRSGPPLIFLRDTTADSRPVPQETPRITAVAPGVEAAAPLCPVPASCSLGTANSLLILFKLWDVPSQSILFLGSSHFGLAEPVQTIREYCAELIRTRSAEQTPTGELLRFSLSHLLDDDDELLSASRLDASQVWSCFEVDGAQGKSFPFNFAQRSRDSDAQRLGSSISSDSRFREAPDWNTITTDSCKIQNGEIALFHLRYKPEQLQWLRQRYEQQRQEWSEGLHGKRELFQSMDASSAIASSPPATLHAPLRSFRAQFSETCVQALEYFAARVVVEFHAVAGPTDGASPSESGLSISAAASSVTLELAKETTYREIIDMLGREVGLDAERMQLLHASNHDRSVPASRTAPNAADLSDTLGDILDRRAAESRDCAQPYPPEQPRIFYRRMQHSWADLETAVPVVILYCDRRLVQTTFEAMIPRSANVKELAAIAVRTMAQIRPTQAVSSVSAPSVIPAIDCFAADPTQAVTEFAEDLPISRMLSRIKVDGVYAVLCMERCDEPIVSAAEAERGVRRVWVHRYFPLGAGDWKPAGSPFPMRLANSDNVVEIRSRLQARLRLDDSRMAQIEVAVLASDDPSIPLAADAIDIRPAQLLAGGKWAALGVYDRSAPKPPPASKVFGAWKPVDADEASCMSRGLAGLDDVDRRSIARLLIRDRILADKAGFNTMPSFTWRIPLQKWREEKRDREYSPEFTLEGQRWRILLLPNGNPNHSVPGCMAAYIELRSERAYYSSVCHFKMRMVHPSQPSKYAWRQSTHTFTNTEIDRGFNDLLTPATIAQYTHDDGCVVLITKALCDVMSSILSVC